MTPKFKHDCDRCVFLGTLDGIDMHMCEGDRIATVIARYGDDGPDYSSGIPIANMQHVNGRTNVPIHTRDGLVGANEDMPISATHRALRVALLIAIDDPRSAIDWNMVSHNG